MKFIYLFALFVFLPSLAYAQTANLETLLKGIVSFTNSSLILFLFGIAFLIFVINVFRYFILNGENEDGRENAKNLAIYSVAAFVFLIIFWGIINLLSTSSGLEGEKQSCPDYLAKKGACPNSPPIPAHKPPVP